MNNPTHSSPVQPPGLIDTQSQTLPARLQVEWRVVLLCAAAFLLGLFAIGAALVPLSLALLWNAKENLEAKRPWALRLFRDALGWGLLLLCLLRITQTTYSSSLLDLVEPLFISHRARTTLATFLEGGFLWGSLLWLLLAVVCHWRNRKAPSSQMNWLGVQGGALLMLLSVAFIATQLPPIHQRLLLFDHQLFTPLRRTLQDPSYQNPYHAGETYSTVYPLGLGSDQDFLSEELGPILIKDPKALRSLCKNTGEDPIAAYCYAGLLLQGKSHQEIFDSSYGKRLFLGTLREEVQPSDSPWLPSRLGWLQEALDIQEEKSFSLGLIPEEIARRELHEVLRFIEKDSAEFSDLRIILWEAPWLPARTDREDFFPLLEDTPNLQLAILLGEVEKEAPLSYSFHFAPPFTEAAGSDLLWGDAAAHISGLLRIARYSPSREPAAQNVDAEISFGIGSTRVERDLGTTPTTAMPYDIIRTPMIVVQLTKNGQTLTLKHMSVASTVPQIGEEVRQLQESTLAKVPSAQTLHAIYQRIFPLYVQM